MRWREEYVKRGEKLAWRVWGERAVIINPRDNMLYPLNPVGTRFWELADGSRTGSEIMAVLLEEFAVERATLAKDLEEFTGQLAEKGLLENGKGRRGSGG